jgi:hypothetical protein
MADSHELALTTEQRVELEWVRDHHVKPYVRERAAAILKVAGGQSIRQVALHGLLRCREPETVKEWIVVLFSPAANLHVYRASDLGREGHGLLLRIKSAPRLAIYLHRLDHKGLREAQPELRCRGQAPG